MRTPRTLLLLGAAVLVVAGLGRWAAVSWDAGGRPAGAGAHGLTVGITANALDDDARRSTDRVRAASLGWMREEFRWTLLEPDRGRMSYARYDGLMQTTASRGVHVLPVLIESPAWTGAAQPAQLPPSLPDWRVFVQRVVERYGPGGRFWREHPELDRRLAPRTWEIWNEAYLPQFSPPRPDPARYAELVRSTVQAGRAATPAVRFLVSAETAYQAPDGSRRGWLDDMVQAVPDLGRFVDALAIHPYSDGGPENTATPRDSQFDRLADFEPTLRRLGIGPKPLWITELGWSTCTRRPPCQTEDQQGRYLAQAFERLTSVYARTVRAVFVYRLDDIAATGPDDPQAAFGLDDRAGRRKPSWSVVSEAARQSRR